MTESTSIAMSMNLQHWPSLGGGTKSSQIRGELDDWEFVSESNDEDTQSRTEKTNHNITYDNFTSTLEDSSQRNDAPFIHRCESTPEFSSYSTLGSALLSDDEFSLINDCNSSVAAESITTARDDTVLLSHNNNNSNNNNNKPKRVPSFKDMILLNAQKMKEEETKKKEQLQQLAEEKRKDAMLRKKQTKTRLIVTPIKRCIRSTGDLRSFIIHEGEEGFGSGGGGGMSTPSSEVIHEDEEALGYSDAQEYYDRKSHGSSGRSKGQRIRPDEARRKELIISKKNAQRKAQGVKAKKK